MPLYGHELSETIDPLTAGLQFGVKLKAGNFIGRDALLKIKEKPNSRIRVGLELDGRRIAREGALVMSGGKQVGEVTSGTFSPTLQKSIAMAYLQPAVVESHPEIEVDIRGKRNAARVVDLPFYERP